MASSAPPPPPLFDQVDRLDDHVRYRNCRDHISKRQVRRALERIWCRHHELLAEGTTQFIKQFRIDFPRRAWELYVLAWLLRIGARPKKSPEKGPDFFAYHAAIGHFWIECVVPDNGNGADAIEPVPPEQAVGSLGPDGPLILRYCNVITAKVEKISKYRSDGIVKPEQPAIVAVNQGLIDLGDLYDVEVPLIVRSLFGIGPTTLMVDVRTGESHFTVPHMPSVQKRNKSEVPTRIFLDQTSASVSAVMFARQSVINLLPFTKQRQLYLAHNPSATRPMNVAALPVRGEVWADGERLHHRGVVADFGPFSVRSRAKPERPRQ